MRPNWNEYFMVIAKLISTRSTCNSRPAGAVIVRDKQILSTGYNGSMPGAPHCSDEITVDGKPFCFRRSVKAPEDDKYNYCRSSHAEANAIARAARFGIALNNSTLFVTLAPCYVCLKQLANAGVKHIYYEYDYESTNKERDEHWRTAIDESPIERFEQLRVSDQTIQQIINALQYPTSKRRLAEDYEEISVVENESANIKGFTLNTVFKRALLDSLMGSVDNDRLLGEPLEIDIEVSTDSKLQDDRLSTALHFLTSLNVIEKNMMSSSKVLDELLLKIMSARNISKALSGEYFTITAILNDGSLDMSFKLTDVNLLKEFSIIIDSTHLIYSELFENLLDRFDISLEGGAVKAIIDRPYIKLEAKDLVKEVLLK